MRGMKNLEGITGSLGVQGCTTTLWTALRLQAPNHHLSIQAAATFWGGVTRQNHRVSRVLRTDHTTLIRADELHSRPPKLEQLQKVMGWGPLGWTSTSSRAPRCLDLNSRWLPLLTFIPILESERLLPAPLPSLISLLA